MANFCQSADPPDAIGPAEGAVSEPVTYDDQAEADDAAQQTYEDLSDPTKHKNKRGVNDDCAPQPDGYGPQPSPDTVPAFLAYPPFAVCSVLDFHYRILLMTVFSPQQKALQHLTDIPETLSI